MAKSRKPRSDSKMYQLSKEVQSQVNEMLLDENMKYSDIQHWLEIEHGMKISLSSISNYAVRIYRTAQRVSEDLERTKFFIDFIGEKSEIDASETTLAILKGGLLQKISTAEEEFNEMSVEKAGRLLVELNRVELAKQKLELEYKRKIDLAFEKMESDILNLIKSDEVLKPKFVTLLSEIKENIIEKE